MKALSGPVPTTALLELPAPTSASTEDDGKPTSEPIELPHVLIPPEIDDADLFRVVTPQVSSAGLRGDEGVGYGGVKLGLRFYNDEVRLVIRGEECKLMSRACRLCPSRATPPVPSFDHS